MELEIIDIDDLGRGLARIDGKVCFINKALPNEIVKVKVTINNKTYLEGKVLDVIKKSKERKSSFCPYSKECDGCSFDITSYQYSIYLKEQAIIKMFLHDDIPLKDFKIVPNNENLGFRNKISLKVIDSKLGYYEENTHSFIEIKNCPIAKGCINKVINDFKLFAFKSGNLTIRCNDNDEIILIINSKDEISIDKKLFNHHKIAGIILNNKVIYQDSFFYERRNGLLYKVSYDAFFQINKFISEKIASDLLEKIDKDDVILDLYCGVGYFSLKMALKAREVIGIEVVKNAVLDALKNKELNHIENVNFLLGKVEDKIAKIPQKFTKVLVDPPRNGLDKKTIKFLLNKKIPTIIYISCNPKTLKRDINKLKDKYEIIYSKGYDMFSYTKHVECMFILKLRCGTI